MEEKDDLCMFLLTGILATEYNANVLVQRYHPLSVIQLHTNRCKRLGELTTHSKVFVSMEEISLGTSC